MSKNKSIPEHIDTHVDEKGEFSDTSSSTEKSWKLSSIGEPEMSSEILRCLHGVLIRQDEIQKQIEMINVRITEGLEKVMTAVELGKACRYYHSPAETVVEQPEERPLEERECPIYMSWGSCKFADCKFYHPDPSPTAEGSDSGFDRSSSVPLYSAIDSQSAVASWSIPQPSTDTFPYSDPSQSYMPVMLQANGVHSGLQMNQAPVSPSYPQAGIVHPPMTSSLIDSKKNMDGYSHHQQQTSVDEFPERPGEKECQSYMKTGDCKYKSACKFHHPKPRIQKSPTLSSLGLPLKPDHIVCRHISRFGSCKYGAKCKYDRTPNLNSTRSCGSEGRPTNAERIKRGIEKSQQKKNKGEGRACRGCAGKVPEDKHDSRNCPNNPNRKKK